MLGKISTTDASTHIVDLYKNLVQGYVNKIVGSRFFIKELLALEKGRLKLPANFNAASVPSVYYSYSLGSILGVGYLGYVSVGMLHAYEWLTILSLKGMGCS